LRFIAKAYRAMDDGALRAARRSTDSMIAECWSAPYMRLG